MQIPWSFSSWDAVNNGQLNVSASAFPEGETGLVSHGRPILAVLKQADQHLLVGEVDVAEAAAPGPRRRAAPWPSVTSGRWGLSSASAVTGVGPATASPVGQGMAELLFQHPSMVWIGEPANSSCADGLPFIEFRAADRGRSLFRSIREHGGIRFSALQNDARS